MTHDGPHIYATLRVPPGKYFLSLYDFNKDGHTGSNRMRDYRVSIRRYPGDVPLRNLDGVEAWPELSRARIRDFWGGVYKRFMVSGPQTLTIEVNRNYSFNTILAGVFFLNKGYTLKRSHDLAKPEGGVFVILTLVVFALLLLAPAFIHFSEAGAGPGALHAPILISLAAGLIVGALAQRTRLCMVGGVRDLVLFKETKLILGFAAILVGALVCNLILWV